MAWLTSRDRRAGRRRAHARDPEQVVPLVLGEHQGPGQGREDLVGRVRPAPLLQPDVVIDRHPGQFGHLLAAQPGGTRRRPPPGRPTSPGRSPARRWRRNAASSPRLIPRRPSPVPGSLMGSSLPHPGSGWNVVPLIPASAGLSRRPRPRPESGRHDNHRFDHRRQQGHRLRHRPELLAARGVTVLLGARDADRGRAAAQKTLANSGGGRTVRTPRRDRRERRPAEAAAWIGSEYGQLDVLVNNAGIARGDGRGLPSETTVETLREVFETNVFGVVVVTNAMLPLLRRAPVPRIVNVSSEAGSIASMTRPGQPAVGHGGVGALPRVQDRAEHGDGHVRERTTGHSRPR